MRASFVLIQLLFFPLWRLFELLHCSRVQSLVHRLDNGLHTVCNRNRLWSLLHRYCIEHRCAPLRCGAGETNENSNDRFSCKIQLHRSWRHGSKKGEHSQRRRRKISIWTKSNDEIKPKSERKIYLRRWTAAKLSKKRAKPSCEHTLCSVRWTHIHA